METKDYAKLKIIQIFSFAKKSQIFLLGFFFFAAQYPANFLGSDVSGARENFTNNYRTDFQGAVQTLTYGLIPDNFLTWSTWLLFIQITSSAFGLTLIKRNLRSDISLKAKVTFTFFVYLTFSLSSQGTRDGTMLSLAILGIGLCLESLREKSVYLVISGVLILLWAGSLRPWVSLAIPLLIFSISKVVGNSLFQVKLRSILVGASITIVFTLTCIFAEYSLVKQLDLKPSYPEQQVMVMDLTATYCWSNNAVTASRAQAALTNFYADEQFKLNICQFFRPDTWVSLRDSKYPSTESLISSFSLIVPEDEVRYQSVRETWIDIIRNDPVTFLQVKYAFASKLLIGSDSREILLPNFRAFFSGSLSEIQKPIRQFLFMPFQAVISLHLLSSLASNLFLLVILMRRRVNRLTARFDITPVLLGANLIWLSLTSMAYIGSNGRYLYLSSFLVFFITFLNIYKSDDQ